MSTAIRIPEQTAENRIRLLRRGSSLLYAAFLVVCLAWLSPARSQVSTTEGAAEADMGIEIAVPSGKIFYVPVFKEERILAVVPVKSNLYAAIRLAPQMRAEQVKIQVFGLLTTPGRSIVEADCKDVLAWPSTSAGSYDARFGTATVLSGLEELGLPVLKVEVTRVRPAPNSTVGSGFCACGRMIAAPIPGKCMAPGVGCGWCCTTP